MCFFCDVVGFLPDLSLARSCLEACFEVFEYSPVYLRARGLLIWREPCCFSWIKLDLPTERLPALVLLNDDRQPLS
jgi:hypothetical protein